MSLGGLWGSVVFPRSQPDVFEGVLYLSRTLCASFLHVKSGANSLAYSLAKERVSWHFVHIHRA